MSETTQADLLLSSRQQLAAFVIAMHMRPFSATIPSMTRVRAICSIAEIDAHILSFVSSKKDLVSCLLVNSLWFETAQPLVWKRLNLSQQSPNSFLIWRAIEKRKGYALNVREVHISMSYDPLDTDCAEQKQLDDYRQNGSLILRILASLQYVQTFHLDLHYDIHRYVLGVQDMFAALLTASRRWKLLRSIQLGCTLGGRLPYEYLQAFLDRNVELLDAVKLSLQQCSCENAGSMSGLPSSNGRKIRLRALEVDSEMLDASCASGADIPLYISGLETLIIRGVLPSHILYEVCSGLANSQRLSHLRIHIKDSDKRTFFRTLEIVGEALQSLAIRISGSYNVMLHDLFRCRGLRELSLWMDGNASMALSLFSVCCPVLETVKLKCDSVRTSSLEDLFLLCPRLETVWIIADNWEIGTLSLIAQHCCNLRSLYMTRPSVEVLDDEEVNLLRIARNNPNLCCIEFEPPWGRPAWPGLDDIRPSYSGSEQHRIIASARFAKRAFPSEGTTKICLKYLHGLERYREYLEINTTSANLESSVDQYIDGLETFVTARADMGVHGCLEEWRAICINEEGQELGQVLSGQNAV